MTTTATTSSSQTAPITAADYDALLTSATIYSRQLVQLLVNQPKGDDLTQEGLNDLYADLLTIQKNLTHALYAGYEAEAEVEFECVTVQGCRVI